jgi:hypothetical protein
VTRHFVAPYELELLYERAPVLDADSIVETLRREMQIDLVSASDSIVAVAHPDQVTHFEEGDLPSITNIVRFEQSVDPDSYLPSLEQTWEWPEAEHALAACRHAVLVTDFTGTGLHYRDRLRRIAEVVAGVAEATHARVCHWRPAGCLLDPQTIRAKLAFACNVRQFNTDDPIVATLMDTLGLAALGLVDAQCYFRALDPDRVAPWLFGVAGYLFTHGDVIKDGETMQGLDPGDRWRCRHQAALVGPDRVVLDIEPGPHSAARPNVHN